MRLGNVLPIRSLVCLAVLLACSFGGFLQLGYSQTEAAGQSPVHWSVAWPQEGKADYGYPLLPRVESFPIYHATPLTGVYSHHSQIDHFQDTFFASWSNQEWDEDAPGQPVGGGGQRRSRRKAELAPSPRDQSQADPGTATAWD